MVESHPGVRSFRTGGPCHSERVLISRAEGPVSGPSSKPIKFLREKPIDSGALIMPQALINRSIARCRGGKMLKERFWVGIRKDWAYNFQKCTWKAKTEFRDRNQEHFERLQTQLRSWHSREWLNVEWRTDKCYRSIITKSGQVCKIRTFLPIGLQYEPVNQKDYFAIAESFLLSRFVYGFQILEVLLRI